MGDETKGLTQREWDELRSLAAFAMQGFVFRQSSIAPEVIAHESYDIAEAMLAEGKRRQEKLGMEVPAEAVSLGEIIRSAMAQARGCTCAGCEARRESDRHKVQ